MIRRTNLEAGGHDLFDLRDDVTLERLGVRHVNVGIGDDAGAARSEPNVAELIRATISDATEQLRRASSTQISLPVLPTDVMSSSVVQWVERPRVDHLGTNSR